MANNRKMSKKKGKSKGEGKFFTTQKKGEFKVVANTFP